MTELQEPDVEATPPLEGGKYVYCIVRSDVPRDFGDNGIGSGQTVYTVHHEDLAAVVSDTPIVLELEGDFLAFLVPEQDQGTDLNGDQDRLDAVLHVVRLR